MPSYRDEAVVLRTHKLGEADRIVTLLTKKHGKVRAVAKGVRRTGSRFGARLEPFMAVDLQCYSGRKLDTVQQVDMLGAYGREIVSDYDKFTAANVIVETADKLSEHDTGAQHYLLLLGALRSLSRGEHPARLTLDAYLLRALSLAGWAPSFANCAVSGKPGPHSAFVIHLGGVVADSIAPPGAPRLPQDTLAHLEALLSGDWEIAEKSTEHTRAQASGIAAAYTQFHLERGLRSLDHLERHIR